MTKKTNNVQHWASAADARGRTWHVGDYCTYIYKEMGAGTIYRVISLINKGRTNTWQTVDRIAMRIEPIFGLFQSIEHRRYREIALPYSVSGLEPIDIVRLGNEYLKFTNFINEVSKVLSGGVSSSDESPGM